LGMLISLLTRSPVVSAIWCFSAVWLVMMAGWFLSGIPGINPAVADYVAITTHIQQYVRGSLSLGPLVFYLSGVGLLLFTSVRVLESRRW